MFKRGGFAGRGGLWGEGGVRDGVGHSELLN